MRNLRVALDVITSRICDCPRIIAMRKRPFAGNFCPENYSLKELAALYRYLYKTERTFASYAEVREAFGLKTGNAPKIGGELSPLNE